jgi:hypothetical protein
MANRIVFRRQKFIALYHQKIFNPFKSRKEEEEEKHVQIDRDRGRKTFT